MPPKPGQGHDIDPNRPLETGKLPGPLLDHLVDTYRTAPDPTVVVAPGYGLDAAAIDVGADLPIIVNSDPITFATDAAAAYLVAVNANDIACMGGIPRWFSVVLLLPEETTAGVVETLFADLQTACNASGVSVIGGHTEVTAAVNRPVFVGTMIGTAGPAGVITPGNAQPGDDLLLTKWIGIEGTALLAREKAAELEPVLGSPLVRRAAKLLRLPGISVVADAMAVLSTSGVRALHDPTEGGVATAIHELASASGCGAEVLVRALPILTETRMICDYFAIDPLGLLSSGALLIAADPVHRAGIVAAAGSAGIQVSHIGRLAALSAGITMIGEAGRSALPRFDADEVTRVL